MYGDIFISYASEDRARAQALAEAFEEQGWSVWWDRDIPPGKTFDEVIAAAVAAAKCVVVLWSEASVSSNWVKEEAAEARERGILVPALIDDVRIPMGFRRIEAALLSDWEPGRPHPELGQMRQAIAALLGEPARAETGRPPAVPRPPKPLEADRAAATAWAMTWSRGFSLAVLVGGILLGLFWKMSRKPPPPSPELRCVLSAQPESVPSGQGSTLSWKVEGAHKAVLEPGVGPVTLPSASASVKPAMTTHYALTITGKGGRTATCAATVEVATRVTPPPPPPPPSRAHSFRLGIIRGDGSRGEIQLAFVKREPRGLRGKADLKRILVEEFSFSGSTAKGQEVRAAAAKRTDVAFLKAPYLVAYNERENGWSGTIRVYLDDRLQFEIVIPARQDLEEFSTSGRVDRYWWAPAEQVRKGP